MQVRNVYLLPMSGGLDQYLANRLTASGRYQVVADPLQADAVLTDQLGAGFEDRMRELYAPPEPTEAPAGKKEKNEEASMASLLGSAAGAPMRTTSFSRGKGNVFLVERSSKRVLWSTYLRPRTVHADELNRAADKIVERLDDAAVQQIKQTKKSSAASPAPMTGTTPAAAK